MTKPSMALTELVEKGAQDDIVRELLGHVAERSWNLRLNSAPALSMALGRVAWRHAGHS